MQLRDFKHTKISGADNLEELLSTSPMKIFDENTFDFLSQFSKSLSDKKYFKYPEIISLGFFCRRANLSLQMKKHIKSAENLNFGRGVTLHYTPSNMPLNFAYSLVAGLLAGNSCVIKLSNIETNEIRIAIQVLDELFRLKKFEPIKNRVYLLRCVGSDINNSFLASIADVRIIWGSNETIKKIRSSQLNPHAFDITFPG